MLCFIVHTRCPFARRERLFLCVCVGAYIQEDMFLKEKARGIGKVLGGTGY